MRGDPYSRCAGLPPEEEARARAMGCDAIPLQHHTHATHSSCDAVQILSFTLPSQFYAKPARSEALPCRRWTVLCHCSSMHFRYNALQFPCSSEPCLCFATPRLAKALQFHRLTKQIHCVGFPCHCPALCDSRASQCRCNMLLYRCCVLRSLCYASPKPRPTDAQLFFAFPMQSDATPRPYDDSACKSAACLCQTFCFAPLRLAFPLRHNTAAIQRLTVLCYSAASAPGQETREPMGLAAAAERREALSRWV